MDRIAITGGAPLRGTIPIYGAKNSALKLQAAALLSPEALMLENMPDLADTRFMAQLLGSLGVQIAWIKEARTLRMQAAEISLDHRALRSGAQDARDLQRARAAAWRAWATPQCRCQAAAPSARVRSICT